VQHGVLAVDGLTFDGIRSGSSMPLIQISDDNPTGKAVTHVRNLKVLRAKKFNTAAYITKKVGAGDIVMGFEQWTSPGSPEIKVVTEW
jgi:hypothetical protein